MISGVDAHSYGPFNVNSRTIELSDADTMTVGTPIDSWLDTTEREITLTIEEAGMYQIEMRADEFDAYLELEGPNDYYREDDDSAGELNARIADFLAPGTYQLTARTAYGTDSGCSLWLLNHVICRTMSSYATKVRSLPMKRSTAGTAARL